MSFREVFARCLIVTNCVLSGIGHLANPKQTQQLMIDSFSKSYARVKELGVALPITPEIVSAYSIEFEYMFGFLLLTGSLLTIFNIKFGSELLSAILILFAVAVHNPYNYSKDKEFYEQLTMGLMNLAMVAGLALICNKKPESRKEKKE